MSLERPDVIDALGLERATSRAVLSIVDSWDWTDERSHLLALQAKLNAYFAFVETGQVWEQCPSGIGKGVIIDVIGRHEVPESGIRLLQAARETSAQIGIEIRRTHYSGT